MHQLVLQLRIICVPKYLEQVKEYLEDFIEDLAEIILGPIYNDGKDTDYYFEGVNYSVDFDEIQVEIKNDSLLFTLFRNKNRFTETDTHELEELIEASDDTWKESGFADFDKELAEEYDVPEGLSFDLETSTISFD